MFAHLPKAKHTVLPVLLHGTACLPVSPHYQETALKSGRASDKRDSAHVLVYLERLVSLSPINPRYFCENVYAPLLSI